MVRAADARGVFPGELAHPGQIHRECVVLEIHVNAMIRIYNFAQFREDVLDRSHPDIFVHGLLAENVIDAIHAPAGASAPGHDAGDARFGQRLVAL